MEETANEQYVRHFMSINTFFDGDVSWPCLFGRLSSDDGSGCMTDYVEKNGRLDCCPRTGLQHAILWRFYFSFLLLLSHMQNHSTTEINRPAPLLLLSASIAHDWSPAQTRRSRLCIYRRSISWVTDMTFLMFIIFTTFSFAR